MGEIDIIVNGRVLDNISDEAKEWFLDKVLNGKKGPFKFTATKESKGCRVRAMRQIELF